MTNISNQNTNLNQLISTPYKYGFTTNVESEEFPRGINENTIRLISQKKQEPDFMLSFRLKAYKRWKKLSAPKWSSITYPQINYDEILYYAAPKQKKQLKSLDEVDPEILATFEKLGIPLNEQKRLSNVAVDAIFECDLFFNNCKDN